MSSSGTGKGLTRASARDWLHTHAVVLIEPLTSMSALSRLELTSGAFLLGHYLLHLLEHRVFSSLAENALRLQLLISTPREIIMLDCAGLNPHAFRARRPCFVCVTCNKPLVEVTHKKVSPVGNEYKLSCADCYLVCVCVRARICPPHRWALACSRLCANRRARNRPLVPGKGSP